jgi:hypothetical protein
MRRHTANSKMAKAASRNTFLVWKPNRLVGRRRGCELNSGRFPREHKVWINENH